MKKIFGILTLSLTLLFAAPAMAEDISVVLDGVKIEFDVQPQIMEDYTMVPMRAVFEALDYDVIWQGDINAFDRQSDRFIYMAIGADKMLVGNESEFYGQSDTQQYLYDHSIEIPRPAVIIDDRTLVPVRAISEASGFKVDWDGDTKTVIIKSDTGAYGVTDGEITEYYKNNYYRAKHILVDNEKLANELLKRAKQGEDFDKLVKEYGTDPGMEQYPEGYVFNDGDMVESFENCTKELKENEIGLCKTDYGYHIISREALRDEDMEDVTSEIRHIIISKNLGKEG